MHRAEKLTTHAVILAGGRGTRFWPRSRTRTPKQLLNIVGEQTMLQQTVARLLPLIPADRIWTVTNKEQAREVRKQLPAGARRRVLIEPVGVNTAAAIGLAAIHIRHAAKGDALMAVLPSDHFIADAAKYRRIVSAALEVARDPGNMVVLGIPPTRPETGFGYIERAGDATGGAEFPAFAVRRFTEKPKREVAEQYIASGNYHWNAGMFFWRVSTYLENLVYFMPKTNEALQSLSAHIGKSSYERQLRKIYPTLENISVDYAILEAATRDSAGPPHVFVIPAEIGWSDIGSWAAVYELLRDSGAVAVGLKRPSAQSSMDSSPRDGNIFLSPGTALDACGNFVSVPGKYTAVVGARDLVVVETPDALLIVPRDRAQDVATLVKHLEQQKLTKLL
jgi:mannose-1-phosphate guanylyltransferase